MVKVNQEECIGCGLCQSICPEVFEISEGKAKVISQTNPLCVKEAIDSCPAKAISE